MKLIQDTIEALNKRADTWEAEQGELGRVVALEIREVIQAFEEVFKDESSTLERLRKLITVELYHCAEDIVPEATLVYDLMFDPEDVGTLVEQCEKEFGIVIPVDDSNKLATVGDLVALIDRLRGEK